MSDEQVKVVLSADIQGLINGLAGAANAVQQASSNMTQSMAGMKEAGDRLASGMNDALGKVKGAFGSLEGVMSKIKGPFVALSGLLAGGAMFKEAISATVEWNGSIVKLSKTMGITTEAASAWMVAMEKFGIDGDAMGQMVMKMTKQMKTHEETYESLGIKTKDANGEWRNSADVMHVS